MSHYFFHSAPSRALHVGTILTPAQFRDRLADASDVPGLSSRALLFGAPMHVIRGFDGPGGGVNRRIGMHESGEHEYTMLITLQRRDVMLHIVLPLGEAAVRDYVTDCIASHRIQLVLSVQGSTIFAVLELESRFEDVAQLETFLRTARPIQGDAQALLATAKRLPPLALTTDGPVTHLLTVLASEAAFTELQRAKAKN
jgi:hypothetical protein